MSFFNRIIRFFLRNKERLESAEELSVVSNVIGRQNFTATFDRYATDELYEAKLHFKDVKNEQGVIVKSRYWLKAEDAREILGKLMPGEKVSFSAMLVETSYYADGFKLLNPVVLTKK